MFRIFKTQKVNHIYEKNAFALFTLAPYYYCSVHGVRRLSLQNSIPWNRYKQARKDITAFVGKLDEQNHRLRWDDKNVAQSRTLPIPQRLIAFCYDIAQVFASQWGSTTIKPPFDCLLEKNNSLNRTTQHCRFEAKHAENFTFHCSRNSIFLPLATIQTFITASFILKLRKTAI